MKCTDCGKEVSVYFMCDEEGDEIHCESCFGMHECYMGAHGEGCATKVFDDGEG